MKLYQKVRDQLEPKRRFKFSESAKDAVKRGNKRKTVTQQETDRQGLEDDESSSSSFILSTGYQFDGREHNDDDDVFFNEAPLDQEGRKVLVFNESILGEAEELVFSHLTSCAIYMFELNDLCVCVCVCVYVCMYVCMFYICACVCS